MTLLFVKLVLGQNGVQKRIKSVNIYESDIKKRKKFNSLFSLLLRPLEHLHENNLIESLAQLGALLDNQPAPEQPAVVTGNSGGKVAVAFPLSFAISFSLPA
jgi:hypothetical protein